MVSALVNGKFTYVPKDKAQYSAINMDDTFSPLTNMVPMKSMVKGQRVIMGSRMFTQALPLENAEAPLVQSARADKPEHPTVLAYKRHHQTHFPGRQMLVARFGTVWAERFLECHFGPARLG